MKYLLGVLLVMVLWGCGSSSKKMDSSAQTNKTTFVAFIKAINEHKVDEMSNYFAENHTFIDAQNKQLTGKQRLVEGWTNYFSLFPDYKIELEEIIEKDSTVIGFGKAIGTYMGMTSELNENRWEIPAVWRAKFSNGKVTSFQIYSDTKIIYEIIKSNQPTFDQ